VIRALRRRHLILGTIVLGLAPLAVAAALAARAPLGADSAVAIGPTSARLSTVTGLPIELGRERASGANNPEIGLVFRATEPPTIPDPLLYWARSLPQSDSIPSDAVLLGPLSGRRSAATLPAATLASGGVLLIVDGARRRIVARAPAPPVIGGNAAR
jgi:hypothetical protein